MVSVWVTEVLRRGNGEATARPARGMGAVSEGITGGLNMPIWQPQHKGFSATNWRPGTYVTYDALRLDCAKSLLGVQIRIPGSNRVRSPWSMEILRQFSIGYSQRRAQLLPETGNISPQQVSCVTSNGTS
jgi:hypothetical protein